MNATCDTCNQPVVVGDGMAGKMVRCPHCGTRFLASAVRGRVKAPKEREGGVQVPWGLIVKIGIVVLVIGTALAVYFGPVRVSREYNELAPKAEAQIKDVLARGLEYHLAEIGTYDPTKPRAGPQVHTLTVMRPTLVMSMPQYLQFRGTTGEGEFTGKYDTRTGQITSDVEIGGVVIPGVDEARRHGTTKIKVTGVSHDNNFHVEVDGRDATTARRK